MKTLKLKPGTKNLFIGLILIGLISFAATFASSPARAWHGYLIGYYYVLCLGLGGLFFTAIQFLTNAGWSSTVRRIPEAFNSWLPMAIILFIPLFFGGSSLFEWMNPSKVAADPLLQMKSAYLNVPFFALRVAALFAVWYFVGGRLVRNSLKQDVTGDVALTTSNIKISAIWIPLFAVLFSLVSFDLIMSLDPHWYSTMFGVNCFANLFLSTLAVIVIVIISMKRSGYFGDTVNANHIQNLGLLMFAFVIFYAYIAFSQFMLIWYGNLPEETTYYLLRWNNGWSIYARLIIGFKFFIPFLLLLPREAKRNSNYLIKFAYLIVIANFVDLFWMVLPTFSEHAIFPFPEFGIFLGFMGAFGLTVANFLSKHPVQPQKDPRVQEALALHQ